jgi:exodeoxyribonuclease V gamma subunit
VAELLDLAGQRLTASQILSFADRDPVRRRFGFRDDDLARLQRWVADSGIRWGLDAAHRAPFKLSDLPSGTWEAGLDRLLLGVTMSEDGSPLFERVLPLDDVDSGSIDLAGRVVELVARVGAAIDTLSEAKTVDAWAATLSQTADALTATAPREAWQRSELQRLLDDLRSEAHATATVLSLPELRALLADRLAGRPTRANFRTGHLTVCTLYPMRSVPHRVVCLLGLDDGAFPRRAPRDGDDLMADDPRIGERDPRSEDRQLLLDAVMAAREHLVITYTGNDERTNLPRPPAVPVGELLDVIDATVRHRDGPARRQVLVRHRLQPFDWRNFTPGALLGDAPWSFDRVALAGARAQSGGRVRPEAFLTAPLQPLEEPIVAIEDLVRFVQHPVRAFLRQRLRISLADVADEVSDALPVELDQLERWDVGQRLLESRLAGVAGNAAIKAEIARGTLPPGVLGKPVVDELYPIVDRIVLTAEELVAGQPDAEPIDVQLALPSGRVLSGTVSGLRGQRLLTVLYSRVGPKHRLASWVRLLAATAALPERALSATTVGRAARSASEAMVTVAKIPPFGEEAAARRATATAHLEILLDLYDRGMREPLPLFCATSAAYAQAVLAGRDPIAAAAEEWESGYRSPREDQELEHQLALGGQRTLEEVMLVEPADDERGEGWCAEEATRFGRLARRTWEGLLARERLSTR